MRDAASLAQGLGIGSIELHRGQVRRRAGELCEEGPRPGDGGDGHDTLKGAFGGKGFDLTLDAHVVSSSIEANNINLFFCYSDPSGTPLHIIRTTRTLGGYCKRDVPAKSAPV